MTGYADYCPISGGVEVLGDRWTPLVIRELMVGAGGFNEIHRGIPRISRTCSRSGSGCSSAAASSAARPGPAAGPDRTRRPCGARLLDLAWTAWRAGIIPE